MTPPLVESIRIFHSVVNIRDGQDLGPGFGIIVTPHPTTEKDIDRIGDAIRAAVQGLKKEES